MENAKANQSPKATIPTSRPTPPSALNVSFRPIDKIPTIQEKLTGRLKNFNKYRAIYKPNFGLCNSNFGLCNSNLGLYKPKFEL